MNAQSMQRLPHFETDDSRTDHGDGLRQITLCPEGLHWVSIDSALSTSDTADYSALSFGYSTRQGHYVLFAERGRWDYETLLSKALAYAKQYPRVIFIVEAAGSGISLISSLRKAERSCFWHHPNDDKMYRAALVLPIFAKGRVFILKQDAQSDWVEPYVNELVSFPNGRFDDQVDSLVQAIRWAEPRVNPGGTNRYLLTTSNLRWRRGHPPASHVPCMASACRWNDSP